jgi:phospholipid/cholesterol/gamma-HCH transport system ATP-binding protein
VTTELRFDGVRCELAGREVFEALTFQLPLHGLTFLTGPSGAGKSVICRLAVGLLKPQRGEITLAGETVNRLPERRLIALRARTPYLVQGPALLDWLTLEENVALAGPEPRRALEAVGLLEHAGRRPPEVSPAVKKRAAIARALALRPQAMLLDEPTTGLDAEAARQIENLLAELTRSGLAALVVTHDLDWARRSGGRVLALREGRLT